MTDCVSDAVAAVAATIATTTLRLHLARSVTNILCVHAFISQKQLNKCHEMALNFAAFN